MTTTSRDIAATPDQVWAVLADGWSYPAWVVGASRIRAVDAAWPEPGAKLHHSVGTWPVLLDDDTESVEATPGQHLLLRARGWPAGEASVELTLTALGAKTHVVIEEDAVRGPGTLVPKPVRALSIAWRNTETLRRLAYLAERREG